MQQNFIMISNIPLYLYGSITILAGTFLIFSNNSTFIMMKIILGIALIVGAFFAFLTAFSRQRKQVQFAYHELHAMAMMVYGIALLFFCHSIENVVTATTFLLIFYSFSEIIFCNWLFNMVEKVVFKIIIVRFLLGLGIGVGTIVAMRNTDYTLQIFGALFIMVGINILFYVPVMKISQSFNNSTNIQK